MIQPIRVIKIKSEKVPFTNCAICKRELKHAFITNQGDMGFNCYMRQIGLPVVKKVSKIKDLPIAAFEGMAKEFIAKLQSTSMEQVVKALIGDIELKYPIRIRSYLFYRVFPAKVNDWRDLSLVSWNDLCKVGDLFGFSSEILQKIQQTETFNNFWRLQARLCNANPLGTQIEAWA